MVRRSARRSSGVDTRDTQSEEQSTSNGPKDTAGGAQQAARDASGDVLMSGQNNHTRQVPSGQSLLESDLESASSDEEVSDEALEDATNASNGSVPEADLDEAEEDATGYLSNEDGDDFSEDGKPQKSRSKAGSRWGNAQVRPGATEGFVRGLVDPRLKTTKQALRDSLYGPDPADQTPALQHIYRWRNEFVLPSRKADRSGAGGYHRSFYHTDAQVKTEVSQDWLWYDDQGGREAFQRLQTTEAISQDHAEEYIPADRRGQSVVMGPIEGQRKFDLPFRGCLDLNQPFSKADAQDSSSEALPDTRRSGWLLNLGEQVSPIAWAPNRDASGQYLAIATRRLRHPMRPDADGQHYSAFRPQPPKKSAIQIWQIDAGEGHYINVSQQPRLRQVLCTDWGDLKDMQWCMIPRASETENGSSTHLGLLATVWGDGSARVLDISLSPSTSSTSHLHISSAAFSARPPLGVFTCVTWISSHSIAAGTSTGSVSIFSIPDSLLPTPAVPILHSPIQTTYITSLTTCYPSRSHMLCTSSASGTLSLTDLTRSTLGFNPGNTILSPRSRLGRTTCLWHDYSQMLLSTDDGGTLTGLPLRRFFGFTGLARFPSGPCASLAVSPVHPFVIAGGYAGDAAFTNPLRRAGSTKEPIWLLRWFRHEWRREEMPPPVPLTDEMVETNGYDDSAAGREGLCRVVEGFAAEKVVLLLPSKENEERMLGVRTINESRTAVGCVAWNPNVRYGGWVAAGMASGLLRIEDVGMDK